jgi:thiol-disulfide isomerase/thioredoxin
MKGNTDMIGRIVLAVCLAGLCGTAAVAYENLEELQKDFQTRQTKALEEYLAAHGDAKDAQTARAMLISGLLQADRQAEAVPLLLKEYDRIVAADKPDLRELYGRVLMPLVQAYGAMGKKDEVKALVEKARKDVAKAEDAEQFGEALNSLVKELDKPGVGSTMDLSFTGLDGKEVKLASMTNKVVLVDFWATWCGPCRGELPNVKAAYTKYHEKGFEIIGISLDQSKEKLEAFLKENDMTWPQYFDGKGWKCELAGKFGITSIPATFLVGKDGKVAAANLRGEKLAQKVGELLGAQ